MLTNKKERLSLFRYAFLNFLSFFDSAICAENSTSEAQHVEAVSLGVMHTKNIWKCRLDVWDQMLK